MLATRLATGDEWRQEDAAGEEGRRSPEQGQLQVPGASQVVGQDRGQIEAEEVDQVGAVVLDGAHRAASGPGTAPTRSRRTRCVARCARVSGTSPGWRKDSVGRLGAVPADFLAPAAVYREHDADAAEQRDEESTDQTTTDAVGPLSTRGSAGQLLV